MITESLIEAFAPLAKSFSTNVANLNLAAIISAVDPFYINACK